MSPATAACRCAALQARHFPSTFPWSLHSLHVCFCALFTRPAGQGQPADCNVPSYVDALVSAVQRLRPRTFWYSLSYALCHFFPRRLLQRHASSSPWLASPPRCQMPPCSSAAALLNPPPTLITLSFRCKHAPAHQPVCYPLSFLNRTTARQLTCGPSGPAATSALSAVLEGAMVLWGP